MARRREPTSRMGASPPGPAPRTTPAQKLLLIALGLAIGLLLAEAVLRVTGAAPEVVLVQEGRYRLSPNPKIGYEPVPGVEVEGHTDSLHDWVGVSNRLGFRDVEHAVAKPEGVFRILVLGDSIAVGQGVRLYENTFPARVERELDAAGLETELLNFAVSGYNTQQEVETLADKGLVYRPDLVLLSYCQNDRQRSDGGILATLLEREQGAEGLVRSRADPRLLKSALYRFLRYRLPARREAPPAVHEDTVDEYFGVLAELARKHRFEVLVVVFPRFGTWLRWNEEHRRIAALSQRHGFHHLDLLEAFQACRREATRAIAIDRYHPSPVGHRCAARAISRHILVHIKP